MPLPFVGEGHGARAGGVPARGFANEAAKKVRGVCDERPVTNCSLHAKVAYTATAWQMSKRSSWAAPGVYTERAVVMPSPTKSSSWLSARGRVSPNQRARSACNTPQQA